VNLGGIHHRPGRVQRLRFVFLTPDEERSLRTLAGSGVQVSAQDVPSGREAALDDVLSGRAID
jgi:PTS system mannose-specific IIB component/fructoselysine and glucoselysine-specific PTS system IIB component